MQIDGSNHPWLEDRGPKLTLLIAVDDATSTVAHAVFRTGEDTRGYLLLLEGLIRQWGIPPGPLYDRHSAFKYNARQKPVPVETTQFARVMRDLGVQQIFALSPQAKGRVERLLETFQERLVTELRLAGASTIDQAKEVLQEFLPKINARFAVAAEQPEMAYRPVPAGAGPTVVDRVHLHQRHPEGGPGQHGEVPVESPATAARSGQLRRTQGGRPGTGRRGADDQVPRRGRGLSGGAAALLGAVGRSQRLLPRPGTAGGRRWGGQQPSERGSTGTPGRP